MPAKRAIQHAALSPAGTGDVAAIAATAGKSILVVSMVLVASAGTVITLKDGVGGTSITGPFTLPANAGWSRTAAESDGFLFRTSPGNALVINQSVDGVDGFAAYYLR